VGGVYGGICFDDPCRIGFRRFLFNGKERGLAFSGRDIGKIKGIRVYSGGSLLDSVYSEGRIKFKKPVTGKSEIILEIDCKDGAFIETLLAF
jgi:hypothetical protein